MNQTVFSLSLVGIASALCEMLLPKGQGEGARGALRLLLSFAVLLLILRPFTGFFAADATVDLSAVLVATAADATVYEEILVGTVQGQGEADFKALLYEWLEAEYGIAPSEAEIRLSFTEGGELTLVKIYLSGHALLQDPHALAAALQAKLGVETEVR